MPVGSDEEAPLGDFIEDSESTSAEAAVVAGFMHDDINRVLRTLDDREQTVVRLRYGLDDGRPRTLDEIGRVFGISRERVRQIERDSMAKLRVGDRSRGPSVVRQLDRFVAAVQRHAADVRPLRHGEHPGHRDPGGVPSPERPGLPTGGPGLSLSGSRVPVRRVDVRRRITLSGCRDRMPGSARIGR